MDREEMLNRLHAGVDPLELSIEKWVAYRSGKGENQDEMNCGLCEIFNNPVKDQKQKCVGCPVFAKTGKQFCDATPYQVFSLIEFDGTEEQRMKIVDEEIDFLKGLRIPNCLNCNRKTIRPGSDDGLSKLPHCACITKGHYIDREKLLFCVDGLSQKEVNDKLRNLNIGCPGWQETPILC